MRTAGIFRLDIQPATTLAPARLSVCLAQYATDERGGIHITPECSTPDELEGWINSLQDDLDMLRKDLRRRIVSQTALPPFTDRHLTG